MPQSNLIGRTLDETYRVERHLGRGGMGTVYLATHLGTDRPVALKVIAPQFMLNEDFVERFRREAKAAGRMRHPNIVDVTDFGFASLGRQRVAYLIMEYLDGCPLAEVLAEESRLPIEWVVDILEQVCSAVEEAHQAGIIHRDLKPDNIWLEPNRRGGYTVKVLDFGLAKHGDESLAASPLDPGRETFAPPPSTGSPDESTPSDFEHRSTLIAAGPPAALQPVAPEYAAHQNQADSIADQNADDEPADHPVEPPSGRLPASSGALTRVGSILGTPLYMSPEQCRGDSLDARSDIFSLGVITYQMLAGEPPFKGDLHTLTRRHIEALPPPPLRKRRKNIPRNMAATVMSALSMDPASRPASAATFASSLRASSEGPGRLLRRAFSLFSEHFPVFLQLGLIAHLPFFVLLAVFLFLPGIALDGTSPPLDITVLIAMGVLLIAASFLAKVVVTGITIWLVVRLHAAPLKPLRLRFALHALRKRFVPLVLTSLRVMLFSVLGLVLGIIPGVIYFVNSSLAVPVVMMENLEGRAAVRRSKMLVKHAWFFVVLIILAQWIIPLASTLIVSPDLKFNEEAPARPSISFTVTPSEWLSTTLDVIFMPLLATLSALLYLKVRQLKGERLGDMLEQFELEELPQTNWQKRMRQRLRSSSRHTRST